MPLSYHIHYYPSIDSTQAEVKRRYLKGEARQGLVVQAGAQEQGKGKYGRFWYSGEGNLLVSLLLSPKLPPASWGQLSFVAAVALVKGLEEVIPASIQASYPLQCKWPNDVLLGGKKIAGILLESLLQKPHLPPAVILGLGVNLKTSPEQVAWPADHLGAYGVEIAAETLLHSFLAQFEEAYIHWQEEGQWQKENFSSILKTWESMAYPLTQVKVTLPKGLEGPEGKEITGKALGMEANGALLVQTPEGLTVAVHAGDIGIG